MEKSPLTISVELPDFIGGGGLCLGGPLERRDNEMFSYNRVAHACYTVNVHQFRCIENERHKNSLAVLARRERDSRKGMFDMNV